MTTVFLGERPPEVDSWLARRRELGQDRWDEVWEGSYHVVPGPSFRHARVDHALSQLLDSRAERAGLVVTSAFNLGDPEDFRVPDGGLHRSGAAGVFVPTAAMVVEVVSPGDESYAKLPFYARHGVEEVLVADPALRTVRLWQLRAEGYEETGRSDLLGVTADELAAELPWP